ncbi:vacuolar protein sorting-associated protein 62 [Phlyctema vagabunda]|uniref:Vacuolar protein sorting-associated protein 62 n=1 Tax=Phlyctema vagabunda TaxID=108571 RepID=A0ABR4PL47_9HELO
MVLKQPTPLRRVVESVPFLSRVDEERDDEIPLSELRDPDYFGPDPDRETHWAGETDVQQYPSALNKISPKKIISWTAGLSIATLVLMFLLRRDSRIYIPSQSTELSVKLAKELSATAVPPYVLAYAPIVVLDKNELFFPSDMGAHVRNTSPALNFTALASPPTPLSLDNLNLLNDLGGEEIYLTLDDEIELPNEPSFLKGDRPDQRSLKTAGKSCVVIIKDRGHGMLDAFYMYFYSFNQGPTVMKMEIGDHVGDWEHNMVRFKNGLPDSIWYSQHNFGRAYTYHAVEKTASGRPVSYSAKGSHANYATKGKHDLADLEAQIPHNVAFDQTSVGAIWDPVLNAAYFTYSTKTKNFTAARTGEPEGFMYFDGRWGDMQYAEDDPVQMTYEQGFHKFTSGPNGPKFKSLDRDSICLDSSRTCIVKSSL